MGLSATMLPPEKERGAPSDDDAVTYTFGEAVDYIGFGRFHAMLVVLCGFGWFSEISELVIMSFVAPQISKDFGLSPVEYGLLGSISFVGMAIGALFWGIMADRFGRWIGFTCTTAMTFVFSLAQAFAPDYPTLLLFRILATIGVGGTLPVDYAHLVEFLPAKNRGRNMAIVDGMGVFPALLFSSLLAYFGTDAQGKANWRLILGVQSIPAGLFTILRFLIPESPRYQLNLSRLKETTQVLNRVAKMNRKSLPPGNLREIEGGHFSNRNPLERFKELFGAGLWKTTPRIWLMAFCAQFSSAGSVFAVPNHWNGIKPGLLQHRGSPLTLVVRGDESIQDPHRCLLGFVRRGLRLGHRSHPHPPQNKRLYRKTRPRHDDPAHHHSNNNGVLITTINFYKSSCLVPP